MIHDGSFHQPPFWEILGNNLFVNKETAALPFSKPLSYGHIQICLLYNGFFSFAIIRQMIFLNSNSTHL